MTKGILIKAPDLFTVDEQLEIQERLKSNDIEVAFLVSLCDCLLNLLFTTFRNSVHRYVPPCLNLNKKVIQKWRGVLGQSPKS